MTGRVTAALAAAAIALCAGCTVATPYPGGDEPIDDGGTTPPPVDEPDAPVIQPAAGEPCELEGTDGLGPETYVIQIRNRECATTVCLHYNLQTFCTHRCEHDADCVDVAGGFCELDIAVGDPEMIGQYCVTPAASRGD